MTGQMKITTPDSVEVMASFQATVGEWREILDRLPDPPGCHSMYKFKQVLTSLVTRADQILWERVTDNNTPKTPI